jgi:hypothetical protein
LEAETKVGGKHLRATVRDNGIIIVEFGIRHGANSKNGHIPRDLLITEGQAIALARCAITKEGYFEILRKKGRIPDNDQSENNA